MCKLELKNIYDKKTEWTTWRITVKILFESWKTKVINATVRHLLDDARDITNLKEIYACMYKFYKNLFKKNVSKSNSEREWFLNSITLPNLNFKGWTYVKVKLHKNTSKLCLKVYTSINLLGMSGMMLLGRLKILFY